MFRGNMESEENIKTFIDYVNIYYRRRHVVIASILILLTITLFTSLYLPPIFQSEATIMIEQQQIPTDLVKSTVISFADERINSIQQKLMTVKNINNIINKYRLYPKERKKLNISELADLFRLNTTLELVNADIIPNASISGRSNKATIAFKLTFSNTNALIAQTITNELTTLFLDENVKVRTERAIETSGFLGEEAEKFKIDIRDIENRIAEYKEKYRNSLPELLPVNLSAIERIENSISQLELQEKMVFQRKINLQTQLLVTEPFKVNLNLANRDSILQSLPELQAEYQSLLEKYSESHPDVKAVKRKISNFKESEKTDNTGASNPVYLQLKSELNIADIELKSIINQKKTLSENLKVLESQVALTHQVERGYYELMRDLDSNKAKYQELKSKYLEAKLSQTLEEEQKAEKFTLLEPARLPEKPIKPARKKIFFIGIAISIVFSFGLGMVVEMMDTTIRGHKTLENITGLEPLVIIPYVENEEDIIKRRKTKIQFICLLIFLFFCSILAIHFMFMPLDLLFDKYLHELSML